MRRVNESLRKVLADGVERLGDPSVGFVTVTGVRARCARLNVRTECCSSALRESCV
jgi:hypothetical protein